MERKTKHGRALPEKSPLTMSVRSGQCPPCLVTNQLLKGAHSYMTQEWAVSTWTRRCWQSPPASAAFNCLLVIDTLKSPLVSQSLSPDLQSLPDIIQTNSVKVVWSNIKSLYLDVTAEFWSAQFQVAVLRSVISHWGIPFPADQEFFPKHDLDGNFHNKVLLQ